MDSHNILSLLGLSLRGGRLAVGEEPVEAAARAKDARVLLLASDAAENTRRRVEHFSQVGQCLYLTLPFSKAELGRAVGRTAAAVVAVTDIGLANAVVRRLADLDEAQYGEAAQRLELKAKRAAERQAERKAHERNVRSGVRKAKPRPPDAQAGRSGNPDHRSGRQRPPDQAEKGGRRPAGSRRYTPESGKPPIPPGRQSRGRQASSRSQGGSPSRPNPYAHSRPVKKGKGSFRKREG